VREDLTLAVIGGGKMGSALVAGLLSSERLEPEQIVVAEPVAKRRDELSSHYGVRAVEDGSEAARGADVVLLAVKPQQIDSVVRNIGAAIRKASDGHPALVISIAAGVTTARLEKLLGKGVPVIRVMPNQAALAGMAVSAISGGADASEEDLTLASELLGAVGATVLIGENLQDAATALSGSGPAYVYLFAEGLIQAGLRQGLSRDQATLLVVETIRGAGEMLKRGGHPAELTDAVASPGGTTIAALEALEMTGFRAALFAAVEAAVERARELG
jgi:pyrroline-5-carboxylate reductase